MHVSSWNLNFPKNNIYKFLRIPWISSLSNYYLRNLQIPGPHLHSWELHSKYFNCNLNYEISRTFRFSHKKHKTVFFRNACELLKSEFSVIIFKKTLKNFQLQSLLMNNYFEWQDGEGRGRRGGHLYALSFCSYHHHFFYSRYHLHLKHKIHLA